MFAVGQGVDNPESPTLEHDLVTSVILTRSSPLTLVSRPLSVPTDLFIGRCQQATPSTVALIESTVY